METDIPKESVMSNPETIRSAAIRRKWRHFIDNSTLHGMQYVFNGQTKIRSIIWAVFLMLGTGYFLYQSSLLIKRYYSYPINTKVTMEYEENPLFPAVTICNFNMLRRSFVKEHKAEELLKYTFRDSLQELGTDVNSSAINWDYFKEAFMEDTYSVGGHQIKEMMIRCSWSGEKCNERNFTKDLTSMGLCHTFNSGNDGREILKVKNAGSKFGLNLVLDVQQHEHISLLADQAGFKVLVHDQETPPMVEELGFSVGPGTTTFAAIRKKKVINLRLPYETNCSASNISNIPGYSKYTTSSCMLTCQSKHIVEKCGCRDIKLPALTDDPKVPVCGINETVTCVFREMANFYKVGGHECSCQVPCETTSYRTSLSYGAFPSKSVAFDEAQRIWTPNTTMGLEKFADALHENRSENVLELNVFFQELNYELIEQQPAYDKESLLGEIGGQLGLCIGASLLTLLEFCDVIITILKIRFGRSEPIPRPSDYKMKARTKRKINKKRKPVLV